MPVRPFPVDFRCPRCGWRTTWQPRSDALSAADLPPKRCPRCGHGALESHSRPPSPLASLLRLLQRGG
jgi:endogenous inhibitor of DNA gyrase (YacG/DUF329 family)